MKNLSLATLLSIFSLFFSSLSFSQGSCNTATIFNEGFFIITPPDSNVTRCFEFTAPTDTIDFEFIPFVTGAGAVCNGLLEVYTLYDASNCDSLDSSPDGDFSGLVPGGNYTVCYNVQCTSGGTIGLIITSEMTTLPIEMSSFDSRVEFNSIKINWTTSSERDNDYFNLFTSSDLENWEKIGTIDGAGNSLSTISYSFLHTNPKNGVNYYMIEQVDYDGEMEKFGPISENFYVKDNFYDIFQKYTILGQRK